MPLSTLRKIHFNSQETILTQVLKEHANTSVQRGLVIFLNSMKLNQTKLNSKLLSTSLQFQSIFKPILLNLYIEKVESLLQVDVEQKLTIQSSQLDMELKTDKNTSSLKIHGEMDGEIKDTLKSEQTTFAVFSQIHYNQFIDEYKFS